MTEYTHSMVTWTHHASCRVLAMIFAIMSILSACIVGIGASSGKADANVIEYLMCSWDKDPKDDDVPAIKLLFEAAQTEDFQRQILYKSQAAADFQNVANTFTNFITTKDFKSVQLDILNNANETEKKYTPYDRFGFSGMQFTNYNGEWNWWKIYYCRANGQGTGDAKDPEDGHLNDYYKDRDRPMDTFSARNSSLDPRVRQRANVMLFANNWNLIIANLLFSLTKIMVALGNMLLELTLSDVASKFGVINYVGGDSGVYKTLFNNIFMNLMGMMMVITAVWMAVKGLIKGQYREAYSGLVQSLACMFAGIVMMVNPTLFVSLPNYIGMFGQNLLLQGITTAETGKNALCSTDEDSATKNIKADYVNPTGNMDDDTKSIAKEFEESSDAIRRSVECEYWRIFTLVPYSLGQYGTDYTNLYASGKSNGDGTQTLDDAIPDGAPQGGDNGWKWQADYAGKASVPMGNKTIMNNWLIYQISTQTSYHISSTTLDPETEKMKKPDKAYTEPEQYQSQLVIVDGANTDWWRVVDALANYKSKKGANKDTNNPDENKSQDNAVMQTDVKLVPTKYWTAWIGGNNMTRILIALLSFVFAVAGMIGPVAIGFSVVAYAIGSVLLMAFAPVALTFGMWAGGKGQSVLKGWFQLVCSVVLKRIVLGFVFMLMMVFMIKITSGMNDLAGWFKSMLLVCIVSYVFYKNRNTITKILGQVNINGAVDLQAGMQAGVGKVASMATTAKDLGYAGFVGGISGMKNGIGTKDGALRTAAKGDKPAKFQRGHSGFTRGALRGMSQVIDNKMYTGGNFGYSYLQARDEKDRKAGRAARRTVYCSNCNRVLQKAGQQGRKEFQYLPNGQALCNECYELAKGGQLPGFQI